MKVQISKRFTKDCEKIDDQRILAKIRKVLEAAQTITHLSELPQLEEMAGYSCFYRLKFDYRYRIGLYLDGETLQFLRVGHREDFYKKFP
jgi:mRNA-degrading endonuclease RelE of RelBE toxin-antitoxin system